MSDAGRGILVHEIEGKAFVLHLDRNVMAVKSGTCDIINFSKLIYSRFSLKISCFKKLK